MTAAHSDAPRDTLMRRLSRLVAVILSLLALVGLAGIVAILISTSQVSKLTRGYAPAGDANRTALQYMLDAETAVRGYTLTRDRSFLQPYEVGSARVLPSIDAARAALGRVGDHHLDDEIKVERGLAQQWLSEIAAPVAQSTDPSASAAQEREGKSLFDRFRAANAVVDRSVEATRADLRSTSVRLRKVWLSVMIAATVSAVAVGAVLGVRTARRIVHPVSDLWSTVQRIHEGDLGTRADAGDGPAEVRAVATALNTFVDQAERAARAEQRAEEMRIRTRPISAVIRSTSEPVAMAQRVVVDLGVAFGVDRVWLHTFDDDRVPRLTLQWHRVDLRPVPPLGDNDVAAIGETADRLWTSVTVSSIEDHETARGAGVPSVHTARSMGARASIVAAIGDGPTAIGVLWLAMADQPRAWTDAEVGLIQRMATELAASLIQGNIIVRQREAVEQMLELDAAKSAFVSTVSHELRTPLTSISGYLEMVLDGDGGEIPAEAADMLRVVDRNAVRLRTLIEDLLTQSRIEAGRLRVNVTRVEVGGMLAAVHKTMAPLADAGDIRFILDVSDDGMAVDGDPRQLEQAVTNLVANAIKFTPAGGAVTLSAAQERGDAGEAGAAIRVGDTGMGIPAEELPRLYDRFFRASNAAQAAIPGTGLGLSIVREIVHGHHGELDVESALDRGTTFLIRLPLAGA